MTSLSLQKKRNKKIKKKETKTVMNDYFCTSPYTYLIFNKYLFKFTFNIMSGNRTVKKPLNIGRIYTYAHW